MKLITLNTWGGRVKDAWADFFAQYRDIDIWCFQEVYKDADPSLDKGWAKKRPESDMQFYATLQKHLPGYKNRFCQVMKDMYGIVTFTSDAVRIIDHGEILIGKGDYEDMSDPENRDHHRKLQWLEVEINGKKVLVMNAHLTHRPEGKRDSEKRLKQSRLICDLLNMFDCPKILVGDFNLLPDTESIALIEKVGMRNLISEYGVESTRTELYEKPLRFADYIFVSHDIKVNDFKVLPDVISDHSPLMLDFDL